MSCSTNVHNWMKRPQSPRYTRGGEDWRPSRSLWPNGVHDESTQMGFTIAYVAFYTFPTSLWFANQFFLRSKIPWLLLWPITTVSCYAILLISVYLLNSHLEAELYKHDFDGGRSFSGVEDTPAMREAMGRLTNDTGRALAPIMGIPWALFWVKLMHLEHWWY